MKGVSGVKDFERRDLLRIVEKRFKSGDWMVLSVSSQVKKRIRDQRGSGGKENRGVGGGKILIFSCRHDSADPCLTKWSD